MNFINKKDLKKDFETCRVLGDTISIDTALAIIENSKVHSDWNKVGETQPHVFFLKDFQNNEEKLTSCELLLTVKVDDGSQLVVPGKYVNGEWDFKEKKLLQIRHSFTVTHWREMPKPPGEE